MHAGDFDLCTVVGRSYARRVRLSLLIVLVALPASAQVLFEDDFESGTLLQSDVPMGKWSTLVVDAAGGGQLLFVSQDAGFSGQHGLRLVDATDAGSGVGNGRFVRRPSSEAFGDVYLRYWVRISTTGGSGGPYPVQLHSSLVSGTIAEMSLLGTPAVARLNCSDNLSFRICPTAAAFAADTWHLVQLGLEGLGTIKGRCVLRVDDQPVCEMAADWVGHGVRDILAGAGAFDKSWDGVMDLDDVLLVKGQPPPARLLLSGPSAADAGTCVAYQVSVRNDFDGGISTLASATQAEITSPRAITVWPSPLCAGDAGTVVTLGAGLLDIGLVFGGPAGTTRVNAVGLSQGLIGGSVMVDVNLVDAGVADAGVASMLAVGCGCSQSPGVPMLFLLALGLARVAHRPIRRRG